jgi:hypothetical protein
MFTSKTKGATVPRQLLVLAATAVVSVAVTAITPAFSASMGGQRPDFRSPHLTFVRCGRCTTWPR